jgi:hypothetical protein
MNILRRGIQDVKAASKKYAAGASKSQRIEVTVERETVTMLVRGQTVENQQAPALESVASEPECRELPPSSEAHPLPSATLRQNQEVTSPQRA